MHNFAIEMVAWKSNVPIWMIIQNLVTYNTNSLIWFMKIELVDKYVKSLTVHSNLSQLVTVKLMKGLIRAQNWAWKVIFS